MTEAPAPILIVDDDPLNRDLLSRRLVRRGYVTHEVASGPEALEYLAAHPVQLVLLDVQMPEMSGLDALKTIRSTQSSARLPVLMVTAKGESADVVAALELGADDYITKPIDFPVAFARIRTQLLRKQAEERLSESEERYALAAQGTNDGLWDWKLPTDEIYYSERWKAILGHGAEEIGDTPAEWFDRVHPEDLSRVRRDLDEHLSGLTSHFESEHRMRHKTGVYRWVLTRGLAIRDTSGAVTRIAGSQSDITDSKVLDALTGLPNRMLLIDRLARALEHQGRHGAGQFAVLFVDLDEFKVVNDSLGHETGDQLLQAVARRLEGSLRVTDLVVRGPSESDVPPPEAELTLARVGGDEFIILLHNIAHVIDATRVAERVHQALARPFQAAGRDVFSTASIGIAMSATGYGSPDEVLRDADIAMHRAKMFGPGRTEVFDVVMRDQVLQRLHLGTAVRQGFERHEFRPFFQPIVETHSGRLVGFEALMRWHHPDRGTLPPSEFLSLIQENGLALPIGQQFVRDVCTQIRQWRDAYGDAESLCVNINFSSRQLMQAELAGRLVETLSERGLEPRHIVVEITESTVIDDFSRAADVVRQLQRLGIRVVLDDFGTGYSSLACLHELPICGLKLDPTFASGARKRREILRAVVALARNLGLTVTAEGIESAEQLDRVRALGCDFAQGYLFARPLDAEAATRLVETQRRLGRPEPESRISRGVLESAGLRQP